MDEVYSMVPDCLPGTPKALQKNNNCADILESVGVVFWLF